MYLVGALVGIVFGYVVGKDHANYASFTPEDLFSSEASADTPSCGGGDASCTPGDDDSCAGGGCSCGDACGGCSCGGGQGDELY